MTFGTGLLYEPAAVGSGEKVGVNHTILAETSFEDALVVGRFAKLDTGQIDNMDGSATPVIAGVVMREVANALEDASTLGTDYHDSIRYMRQGLCTVDVVTGVTPALLDRVYISNDGDANDGKAITANTGESVNAEFLYEVKTDVWVIFINAPPSDVSAHVADALGAHAATAISFADAAGATAGINVETGLADAFAQLLAHLADAAAAHAASAVSLLDTGAFTAEIEVEAALAEIYPLVPVAIADPGDAGVIPVTRSGTVAITTTGVVDTRTLAIPAYAGQRIALSLDVDAGDAVITVASAANQAGNNTLTMADAGDIIELIAVQLAGALVWRIGANDGVALSTV